MYQEAYLCMYKGIDQTSTWATNWGGVGGRDYTEKQQCWNTYTAIPSTPCGWHSHCRTSTQRRTEQVNFNYQQCYTPPRNTILVIPISFSISPKTKIKQKTLSKGVLLYINNDIYSGTHSIHRFLNAWRQWTPWCDHTLSIAFRHLPPNSARFGYATEEALFISMQLSTDAVSALRKVLVLIRLWKPPSTQARM